MTRQGVRDGEFAVGGGFGSEQPDFLTGLDRISFVPIPTRAALDGMSKLHLYEVMGLELVIFQSPDVAVGGHWCTRKMTRYIERSGWLFPVDTGKRGDSAALMHGTMEC